MKNQLDRLRFSTLCIILFIGIVVSPAWANYQSQAGRWMQQDPMQYVDGLNLYEYTRCNPVFNLDFSGMYVLMKNSEDEPANTYKQTVIDHGIYPGGDYKMITPTPSDYKTIIDIHKRALKTRHAWAERYPLSHKLLMIYMNNVNPSGSKMIGQFDVGAYMHVETIDYKSLIENDLIAMFRLGVEFSDIARFIESNMVYAHGSSIRTNNAQSAPGFLNWDNNFAIAGHSYWYKAENIQCNDGKITATFKHYLWDVYDFASGWRDKYAESFNAYVTGGEMQWMHQVGRYRAFFVYGEASFSVSWQKGTLTEKTLKP